MGVDISVLNFIAGHKQFVKGNTLQIGRQGLHYAGSWADRSGRKAQISNKILSDHGITFTAEQTVDGGDGHTEKLFKMLGADTVDTIDYSPYENCSIVHDLNLPIDTKYHNSFDYILDAGTIEHIYDVKTVIDNYKNILRVDGVIAILTVCNNFAGHGFYQFSPEFFRTIFSRQAGFETISLDLYELTSDESFEAYQVSEPRKGDRQEFQTSQFPHYIAFAAKKIEHIDTTNFQQSDYLKAWGQL
jgi:SAM-dependent methyltransferase